MRSATDVSRREALFVGLGLVFFALFILVMWRATNGSGYGKDIAGAEIDGAEYALGQFNNATISPNQSDVMTTTCQCPSGPGVVVQGSITESALMGQSEHEGNSPYFFADCEGDAKQMLMFLQDEEVFGYAQSITHANLGSYPPRKLYFTWDQTKGQCNFFLTCAGMGSCGQKNVATGLVAN